MPWRAGYARMTLVGWLLLALTLSVLAFSERASSGAFALFYPGVRDSSGGQLARITNETNAEIHFPAYNASGTFKDRCINL